MAQLSTRVGEVEKINSQYAALCDEYSDIFADFSLPPERDIDHHIDLLDPSKPPPKP